MREWPFPGASIYAAGAGCCGRFARILMSLLMFMQHLVSKN